MPVPPLPETAPCRSYRSCSPHRTERRDLAEKRPSTVKELADKYDEWAKRAGVRPWPEGGKNGKS